MAEDPSFEQWEEETPRRLITIMKMGDGIPIIEWDDKLTRDEVLASLVKVILFLTFDDYMDEVLDESEWQDPPPEGSEG